MATGNENHFLYSTFKMIKFLVKQHGACLISLYNESKTANN